MNVVEIPFNGLENKDPDSNFCHWRPFLVRRVILLITMTLLMSGCLMSKSFIKYEEHKAVAVADGIVGVKLMLNHWDFRSGLLQEGLSAHLASLSSEAVFAFKDLDILSAKYKAAGSLSDFEYGQALGLILKLKASVAEKILEMYFPAIFNYLPVGL